MHQLIDFFDVLPGFQAVTLTFEISDGLLMVSGTSFGDFEKVTDVLSIVLALWNITGPTVSC